MSKPFKNLDQLFNHIQKSVGDVMTKVAEEAQQVLYDYMDKEWYDAYNPSSYDRTYELLESITVAPQPTKVKNGWQIEVYFDTDKINPYKTKSGEWNQHMSLDGSTEYNGKSISEWLIEWIVYGQDSPIFSWEGVYPFDYTAAELERTKKHFNRMMNELEREGFRVKI